MRLFSEEEISDLTEYINKTENQLSELSTEEADATNEHLRKNQKYYINNHMIINSPKNPKSIYLNVALSGSSYVDKLEEIFALLQAPYRIYLG